MKLYILTSLIIFCCVIGHTIRRNNKLAKKQDEAFWDREARANEVRKQPIENLDYVHIPGSILSLLEGKTDAPFPDYYTILDSLCQSKMVNLSQYTNTDLKLAYGTANLTVLSEYDQNFSLLIRTVHQAAEEFKKAEDIASAKTLWEYAVSIQTDITGTYTGLAQIYLAENEPDKIQSLITAAKLLDSPRKNVILRNLEPLLPAEG